MERTQHKPAKQFNVVYKFAKLTSETTFMEHKLDNTRMLTMKNYNCDKNFALRHSLSLMSRFADKYEKKSKAWKWGGKKVSSDLCLRL